jgi:hypothetical protein
MASTSGARMSALGGYQASGGRDILGHSAALTGDSAIVSITAAAWR